MIIFINQPGLEQGSWQKKTEYNSVRLFLLDQSSAEWVVHRGL